MLGFEKLPEEYIDILRKNQTVLIERNFSNDKSIILDRTTVFDPDINYPSPHMTFEDRIYGKCITVHYKKTRENTLII